MGAGPTLAATTRESSRAQVRACFCYSLSPHSVTAAGVGLRRAPGGAADKSWLRNASSPQSNHEAKAAPVPVYAGHVGGLVPASEYEPDPLAVAAAATGEPPAGLGQVSQVVLARES